MKKRKGICLMVAAVFAVIASACTMETNKTYIYKTQNGDEIQLKVDTSDGYTIWEEDGHFFIGTEDNPVIEGCFVGEKVYESVREVKNNPDVTILHEQESKGDYHISFQFWGDDGEEYQACQYYKRAKTGILMRCIEDEEVREEAAGHLSVTYVMNE